MEDRELLDAYYEKYLEENRRAKRLLKRKETVEKVIKVCRRVHGEDFAEKCEGRIRADGYVNVAQYYFGLHYQADSMPKGNDNYLRLMEESGFSWFKRYQPRLPAKRAQKE
jgi:FMN reductase [NAD(P)H]